MLYYAQTRSTIDASDLSRLPDNNDSILYNFGLCSIYLFLLGLAQKQVASPQKNGIRNRYNDLVQMITK